MLLFFFHFLWAFEFTCSVELSMKILILWVRSVLILTQTLNMPSPCRPLPLLTNTFIWFSEKYIHILMYLMIIMSYAIFFCKVLVIDYEARRRMSFFVHAPVSEARRRMFFAVLRKQVHVIDDQTFAKENSWISWGTSYILDGFRYKRKATLVWNSESWRLKLIFLWGIAHLLKFNFREDDKMHLFQRSLIVLIS